MSRFRVVATFWRVNYKDIFSGFADVMVSYAKSLHVHNVSVNASMPRGGWGPLRWCRVERCPSLEDTLFHKNSWGFSELEVIWVSELAKAPCLWTLNMTWSPRPSFGSLRHLHLRTCPRLQYALPLWLRAEQNGFGLVNLETIHVVRCDLKHIFVLGQHEQDITSKGFRFPSLTTIHLYDLPMLRDICEMKLFAPKLKTVRIRGCFGLRRLPATVEAAARGVRLPRPTVEVEKDVWDKLEWDGLDAGHHPSYYEPPLHSRHYRRRRLLRGTVLR